MTAKQAAWQKSLEAALKKGVTIEDIRAWLHERSPHKDTPVDYVRWVPTEKVSANNYNPNSVAGPEMALLKRSVMADRYTQPGVVAPDGDRFVVVDGFHRYLLCRDDPDIRAMNSGMLPVVVLKTGLAGRMAATVRHNRARGRHSVGGMSELVYNMLQDGMSDAEVCNELGMEPEELLRLKHITGFSKLFEDVEYRKEWQSRSQVRLRLDYEKEHGKGTAEV